MKKIILPLLAVALGAAAGEPAIALSGAELGAWTQDYAAATNAAATSGKPVFLDFTGSDWCGWCMLMEEKVFSTPEWKEWASTNVYLVTLDFPRDKSKVPEDFQARNRALSKEFGVSGYPTYVVLDAQGKRLGRLGADRNATPAKFIRQLCKVLGIDPPPDANAVPADPAAKKLVEDLAAAFRAAEKEAEGLEDPTVAQFTAVNRRFSAALAAIDTNGVPDGLLASFRTFSDAFAAMEAEFEKLDQTKTLDEIGEPPEPVRKAVSTMQGALGRLDEAAEACGVEDVSDLLL